ncbi:hypothetical protein [Saccharopolyspora taberi]|uniref:SMP-30/gluconolactonase/LRE family protein n=1 Tax=Saccharopolyspora taberi TaxID=60895 RepID=A0ABN3V4J5_9PSEU
MGLDNKEFPDVIRGTDRALHPEGVAWDPSRSAFLVGSLRYGTVSVVTPDGATSTLVKHENLIATGGIRADVERNRLLVTYDDVYAGPGGLLSAGSTPETAGRHAGLGIFELDSGKLVQLVDLGWHSGLHLANDLALDADGNAYVTDSFAPTLFRVDPAGNASVFLEDDAFDAPTTDGLPEVGLNGIAYHPDGYLLTVRYDTGELLRVPLDGTPRATKVDLDTPVIGADGIALRPDGDLVVATNTIRSAGYDGAFLLRSEDGWKSATAVRDERWPDASPTTIAVTPHGDYILSSSLQVLFWSGGQETSDGFVLRRH